MIKEVESLSINDFEVIAEADEEVKEYETAKAFIEACKDLENKFNKDVCWYNSTKHKWDNWS